MNGAQESQIMDYYKALKTNDLFPLLTGLGQLWCLGEVSIWSIVDTPLQNNYAFK
jgi:hypothetical protein